MIELTYPNSIPLAINTARSETTPEAISRDIAENLMFVQGRHPWYATRNDLYLALAYTIRDRLMYRSFIALERLALRDIRRVAYLSAEYLLGPQLRNNLINLQLQESVEAAVAKFDIPIADLYEQEAEPGLGNGGLGRLAACYLESMATLGLPAIAYGIRYEFGLFEQTFVNGWQVERSDEWLTKGYPWEIHRPEIRYIVPFGGYTTREPDDDGNDRVVWKAERQVYGVAYDTYITGFSHSSIMLLRLWKAEALESLDFATYNQGDYVNAVAKKISSENITKVLYPNDTAESGKQLRLEQQLFFVSCALQDMVNRVKRLGKSVRAFNKYFIIQLNDTHPSIAVAELMRLLVDEENIPWEEAWAITQQSCAYTNHTLLPEALEKWPLGLFGRLLPRHLEIIYEINKSFLAEVEKRFPNDKALLARMSIIDETGSRFVRMAHLATVGSKAINGVSALHSDLLKSTVLADFVAMWPERFVNVTNGISPRRFLRSSNPQLSKLISRTIGDSWLSNLDDLRALEPHATKPDFQKEWQAAKHQRKIMLAKRLLDKTGVIIDPNSIYDVQAKRIHEYKRQMLNVLHVVARYLTLKNTPNATAVPRTVMFAGKAAPGYWTAKMTLKLIHDIAAVVNADTDTNDLLKVVFVPDFTVKQAEWIYPAADLSEQISLAGMEASGTGNMKFALNGALTIGTYDGANIEILQAVGEENFFRFGMDAEEVVSLKDTYNPTQVVAQNQLLTQVTQAIRNGLFSPDEPHRFADLMDTLIAKDPYMCFADFPAYCETQLQVDALYAMPDAWTQKSILNTARVGFFSADRAIAEYCKTIWDIEPGQVD